MGSTHTNQASDRGHAATRGPAASYPMLAIICVALIALAPLASAESSLVLPGASRSLLLDAASAGERLVIAGDFGHILYSDDEGDSWIQADVPTRTMLTAVHFPTAQRGWAVGHDGIILHSADAGRSWTQQRDGLRDQAQINRDRLKDVQAELAHCRKRLLATSDAEERLAACSEINELQMDLEDQQAIIDEPLHTPPLLDVFFVDELRGLAVGAFNTLLRTTDGGVNWRLLTDALDNPYDFHLNAITGGPDGRVWIAAEGGLLFASEDAGATWTSLDSPYEGSWFGIIRAPASDTLLVFGLGGNAFRSVDGGQQWQRVDTGTERSLAGGVFVGEQYALLVGSVGTLLASSDGGARFAPRDWGGRQGLSGVAAARERAILVGQGGVHHAPAFGEEP